MTPVAGHPYALAQVSQDRYGQVRIDCYCRHCRETWNHACRYPKKAPVWIAHFAARHHHNVPGLRDRFARRYHVGLQSLRR